MINLPFVPYTDLASSRRPLESLLPLPMPLSLHCEPCAPCSLKCKSCPQYLDDYKAMRGTDFMPLYLYNKIIGEIGSMGRLKAMKLFGYGEPMLNPNLPEMVRLGKQVADRVEITSNITKLNERMARGLIDAQLDYLRVSIYGMNQVRHNEFTGRKYDIDQLFRNLAKLRELRDRAGSARPWIYCKMFEGTSPEEEETFRAIYGPIADEVTVEVLHNMSGIGTERLGIPIPERTPHKVCPLPFYMMAVGANGDVSVCCIDFSFAAKVGNVKEQSLKELWTSPAFNEVRRKHLEGRRCDVKACRNCQWDWNHPDADRMSNLDSEVSARLFEAYR